MFEYHLTQCLSQNSCLCGQCRSRSGCTKSTAITWVIFLGRKCVIGSIGSPRVNLPSLWLTLYHTILTFNDPKEEGFGKHCGKRRQEGHAGRGVAHLSLPDCDSNM